MIRFACPGCAATFTVADEKAGKSGKCPKCQSQFTIPSTGSAPAPTKMADRPAPAPMPAADDAPVEIQPCPKCSTRLSVMPSDVGLDIECPNCQTVFKALKAGSTVSKPAPTPKRRDEDDEDDRPARKSSRRDDDDEDDRPKKKTSRRDEEDEDDRPSKRGSRRGDDDEEDDRPSRRGSRRGDDEDDDRSGKKYKKKKRGGGGSMESKKTTAGLLGLFLGAWGVHKFYLGYSSAGAIQIVVTIVTCGTGGIIGFIEGIIYLTKSDEDFIETYQRNEKQWF